MINTRWNWEDIKQHFAYTWWAYVLVAALMLFGWQMAYHATEYEPPADKKLQITIAGVLSAARRGGISGDGTHHGG